MNMILASGSPRRKELLEMLGVKNMKIIPAKGEEKAPEGLEPGELVKCLASAKGREVVALCPPEDVVIAADTIVWHEGRVYGKPHSRQQAVEMLRSLSGRTHQVYTGVSVIREGREPPEYEMKNICQPGECPTLQTYNISYLLIIHNTSVFFKHYIFQKLHKKKTHYQVTRQWVNLIVIDFIMS